MPRAVYYGVTGLALLFVLSAWIYSGGYPYIYDGNETALSFVHALSLYNFNPVDFSFLTSHETEFNKAAPDPALLYTHNPNFPRYIHYLLLLAGVKSFTAHVLLITLTVTLLNMLALKWLMSTMIGDDPAAQWITVLAAIVMVLDYHGFLSYTVNTYRAFVFCLLWLCLLSVASPWRPWAIVIVFFALFQLEYGFAVFVLGSAAALFFMRWPAYPLRTAAAAIAGVSASLAAYFVQLLTYDSIATIFAQFNATQQRRGGGKLLSYFTDTVPLLIGKIQEQYSSFQNTILLWAFVSALVTVTLYSWRRHDDNSTVRIRLGLAQLFLALIAGAVFASFLLTNYFLEAYFGSLLPLMTFFHVIASAVLAFDLFVIASAILRATGPVRIAVAVVIGGLVSAPMAHRSSLWFAHYPGLSGGYVEVLKKHYMGKPILVLGTFNQLPTAITWGPTLKMGPDEFDAVTANLSRFDRFRNEKKQIVFLCLDLHWVGCDSLVNRMLQRGDELLFRGADFAFIGMTPR